MLLNGDPLQALRGFPLSRASRGEYLAQRGQSSFGVSTLAVKSQMGGVVVFGARLAPIQHSALLLSVKVAPGSRDQTGSWAHTWVWPEGAVGRPLITHPLVARFFLLALPSHFPLGSTVCSRGTRALTSEDPESARPASLLRVNRAWCGIPVAYSDSR